MTPTQEQIDIAKQLHDLGLCQGAKLWVVLTKPSENRYEVREEWQIGGYKRIGPLPTATECWPEIRKFGISGTAMISLYPKLLLCAPKVTHNPDKFWFEAELDEENLDQAFRLALIALKENK